MCTLEMKESYQLSSYHTYKPIAITCCDCQFYIAYPAACSILIFDDCMQNPDVIPVSLRFYDIHYDAWEDCFYALAHGYEHSLFILDHECCILQQIQMTCSLRTPLDLTSDSTHIYVNFKNIVLCIEKDDMCKQDLCFKKENDMVQLQTWNQGFVAVHHTCEYHFVFLNEDGCEVDCIPFIMKGSVFDICVYASCIYVLWQDTCGDVFVSVFCMETHEDCEESIECCDLICKTAKVEEALACILNAEGMKIQEAIHQHASIKELICINESVACTLSQIAHIEHLLYCKLMWCKTHMEDDVCCELEEIKKSLENYDRCD